MKIKTIISRHRRDFSAYYECEHCGHITKGQGYDDANFHRNVIPKMTCPECGRSAPVEYRPLATKYPDDMLI